MSLKRDLLALYGIPLLLYAGLYWGCRDEFEGYVNPVPATRRQPANACAIPLRANQRQDIRWRGHVFTLPFRATLVSTDTRLDAHETFADCPSIPDQGQLSLQLLTPASDSAFDAQSASTCSLSQDRCWSDTAGGHTLSCLRSGGIPDPSVTWTPSGVCKVPDAGVRVLWQGEGTRYIELYQAILTGFSTQADSVERPRP
jgi:hypothetical protein